MAEVDHEKLMRPVGNGRAPLLGASDVTPCEEKIRLTTEYQTATEIFSKAVTELHEKMGTSSQEEYERLQHASEEWRVHSEQARLALEQHIAAHRC